MAFMTQAGLGANIALALQGGQQAAQGYTAAGELQARGAEYQGAVDANQILVKAENDARTFESQSASDNFNAALAAQLAHHEEVKAGAAAHEFRREGMAALDTARATRAASGLLLEGSPLMVDENTFAQIEYGASRLVYGGQLASSRLRNQSKLLTSESKRLGASADFARKAGGRSAENIVGASKISASAARLGGAVKASTAMYDAYGRAYAGAAKLGTSLATRNVNWGF